MAIVPYGSFGIQSEAFKDARTELTSCTRSKWYEDIILIGWFSMVNLGLIPILLNKPVESCEENFL